MYVGRESGRGVEPRIIAIERGTCPSIGEETCRLESPSSAKACPRERVCKERNGFEIHERRISKRATAGRAVEEGELLSREAWGGNVETEGWAGGDSARPMRVCQVMRGKTDLSWAHYVALDNLWSLERASRPGIISSSLGAARVEHAVGSTRAHLRQRSGPHTPGLGFLAAWTSMKMR